MKVFDIVNETRYRVREFPGFVWDDATEMLTRPDGTTVKAASADDARRAARTWNARTARLQSPNAKWRNFKRSANNPALKLENMDNAFAKWSTRLQRIPGIGKIRWIFLLNDLFGDMAGIATAIIEEENERAEAAGEEFDTVEVTSLISAAIWTHLKEVFPAIARSAAVFITTIWASTKILSRVINSIMWVVRGFGLATGPGAPIVWLGTFAAQIGLSWFMTTDYGKQKMRDAWIWTLEALLPGVIGLAASIAVKAGFESAEGLSDAARAASETIADTLKTQMESQAETILNGMDEFGGEVSEDDVQDMPQEIQDRLNQQEQPDAAPTPAAAANQSFKDIVGAGTW
jgi:hypothetical protein